MKKSDREKFNKELLKTIHRYTSKEHFITFIENLLTGSPKWFFRYKKCEKHFEDTCNEYGDTHITRSSKTEYFNSEINYKYGKEVTPYQKKKIEKLIENDFTDKEIRLLITNNVIKKSGEISINKTREICFMILGGIAITSMMVYYILFSALVSVSPMVIVYKAAFLSISIIIFTYIIFIFYYFSIFPQKTIWKLNTLDLKDTS